MISDYIEHLRERGYSANTMDISTRWLQHFFSRYPSPVKDLKPADLTRYHKSLHWEPGPSGKLYSESSINQAVGVLRSFFRWCLSEGHLKTSPAEHLVTRRPPDPERVFLTPAQARALLALPDPATPLGLRDRAILGLIVEYQASPAVLSRLNLTDFQPDTGALLLQGRKRRILSLGAGLQADIERYLRLGREGYAPPGEQALFLNHKATRLSPNGIRTLLKNYCRRAQLPKPYFSS